MIIKVFGGPGEGKSTIARLIVDSLKREGISVECADSDLNSPDFEKNLKTISDSGELECVVRTIGLQKRKLPEYVKKKYEL